MDRHEVTFLVTCVVVVLAVFGVYSYHKNQSQSVSVMQVVQLDETSTNEREYSIYRETTVPTSSVTTYLTTETSPTDTTMVSTTKANVSDTITTTKVTTATTTIKTTTKATTTHTTSETTTQKVVSFPISLNLITHDELVCINGIGDVTANKIISYREQIGYYTSRYQLLEIDGIGESKMQTIMEYTYIENEDLNYGQEPVLENYVEEQTYYVQFGGDSKGDAQTTITTTHAETSQAIQTTQTTQTSQSLVTTTEYVPIDLNSATLEELCTIPNLNVDLAQGILELRQTIGQFSDVHELLYVDGISERLLNEIVDYVYVRNVMGD